MRFLFNIYLVISISSLITSCNKDVTIIGSSKISRWVAPQTIVINKTLSFANGTSLGIIKIQVFDSKNIPLQNLSMNASPHSTDVNFVSCTTSDIQGVIFCRFTSTVAGTSNIDFTDGVQTFTTNITFVDLPTRLDVVRVSNTQILRQTASGYTVTSGLRKTNWKKNTSSSYIIDTETPIFKLNLTGP